MTPTIMLAVLDIACLPYDFLDTALFSWLDNFHCLDLVPTNYATLYILCVNFAERQAFLFNWTYLEAQ